MPKTVSAPAPAPVQEALALCCRHAVERARSEGRPVLAAWSVEIDARSARDPLAMGAQLAQPGFRFYWEHPRSAFALAAGGVAVEVRGSGVERFTQVSDGLQAILGNAVTAAHGSQTPLAPHAVGGFSFFPELSAGEWPGFHPGHMVLPQWLTLRDGERQWLQVQASATPTTDPAALATGIAAQIARLRQAAESARPIRSEGARLGFRWLSDDRHLRWLDVVRSARDAIRAGALRKVVLALSRELEASAPPSPDAMLGRLRNDYPNCFSFLIDPGQGQVFLGATPERLLKTQNGTYHLDALAGTMPRGSGAEADQAMGQTLLSSPKERQEHAIVVDDIVELLSPFGEVHAPDEPELKALANVWHLFTPIALRPTQPVSLLSLVKHLHPTSAVGGMPRESAFALIHRMEDFDRGWYGSPVGWQNGRGHGEFAVALRKVVLALSRE
ncbi:MAG TPA: isochorismate synthase, partial [bacterium]